VRVALELRASRTAEREDEDALVPRYPTGVDVTCDQPNGSERLA